MHHTSDSPLASDPGGQHESHRTDSVRTPILRKAVSEPETVSSAYRTFHNYPLGNQLLAVAPGGGLRAVGPDTDGHRTRRARTTRRCPGGASHWTSPLIACRPTDLLSLVVDSTGLSVFGEGEWAKAKHGGRGKRGWKKLHLGVDRSVSSSLRRSRSRPRMTPRLASGL